MCIARVAWITKTQALRPTHSATIRLMSEIGIPRDDSTHALFMCMTTPEIVGGTKARLNNQREFEGPEDVEGSGDIDGHEEENPKTFSRPRHFERFVCFCTQLD